MRKARFAFLLDYFLTHFPAPETELHYASAYELVVAVVLSAQCTDKRVNLVTPAHLAAATPEEVFPFIRSVSYPNNKAKHLAGLGRVLTAEFGGEVPATIDELQRLPGVGRKTANVVVSVIYNQPAMAVDTHVFRVSRRLGLVPGTATTPLAVEKGLMRHIPLALVPRAHHWLILHGRYTCVARSPKCGVCPLQGVYAFYTKNVAPKPTASGPDAR